MKKLFGIAIACLVMAALLCVSVFAAESAFENVYITENTELYDDPDTMDEGGSGNPIQFMEDYGVGYSSLNDQVIFKDLDFGSLGADKMWISFSFGAEDRDPATLAVYVDKKTDNPAATFECGYTGGWEKTAANEFAAPIAVPAGVHTIIVEFTNSSSGSFSYIRFRQSVIQSAFGNVEITEDTLLYDDPETMNEGGNGTYISYMEDYGVGNSSLNDQVIFQNLDFGDTGADKMWIAFSFGAEDRDPSTLAVYIDEKTDTPAATFECGYTGGWEKTYANEFETAIDVPAGIHTIIVEFTNSSSGSFSYVRFNPAPVIEIETEAPATEAPAAAAPAETAAPVAETAAPVAEAAPAAAAPAVQTGDVASIAVIAAVVALGAAVVIGKKH